MGLAQICHTFTCPQLLPAGVHPWNDTDHRREAMGKNPELRGIHKQHRASSTSVCVQVVHSDGATGTQHVASTGAQDSDRPTHS